MYFPFAVYSYGVILWELLTRQGFFEEIPFMYAIQKKVVKGKRPTITACPEAWESLIKRCWAQRPEARPSFAEVVQLLPIIRSQYHTQELLTLDMRLDVPRSAAPQNKEDLLVRLMHDRHVPYIQPDGLALLLALHCIPSSTAAPAAPTTTVAAARTFRAPDLQVQTGLDAGQFFAALKRLEQLGYIGELRKDADDSQSCVLLPLPRHAPTLVSRPSGSVIARNTLAPRDPSPTSPPSYISPALSPTSASTAAASTESSITSSHKSASHSALSQLTTTAAAATTVPASASLDTKAERRRSVQLNLSQISSFGKPN